MEYLDLVQSIRGSLVAGMEAIGLYMTVVSGFLVVTYTIGKSLTKFQVFLVSSLFIGFSTLFTLLSYQFFASAYSQSEEFGPEFSIAGIPSVYSLIVLLFEVLGTIGSLVFLYRVRKDRNGT